MGRRGAARRGEMRNRSSSGNGNCNQQTHQCLRCAARLVLAPLRRVDGIVTRGGFDGGDVASWVLDAQTGDAESQGLTWLAAERG